MSAHTRLPPEIANGSSDDFRSTAVVLPFHPEVLCGAGRGYGRLVQSYSRLNERGYAFHFQLFVMRAVAMTRECFYLLLPEKRPCAS